MLRHTVFLCAALIAGSLMIAPVSPPAQAQPALVNFLGNPVNLDVMNTTTQIATDFHIRLYGVMPWDVGDFWIVPFPFYVVYPLYDDTYQIIGTDIHWYGAYVMPGQWAHVGLVIYRWLGPNPYNVQYWWTFWCCPIYDQIYLPNIWQLWRWGPLLFPIDVIVFPLPPIIKPGPIPPPLPPFPPIFIQRRVNVQFNPIGLDQLMQSGPGSDLWVTGMPIDPTPVPLNREDELIFDFSELGVMPDMQGYAMMYSVMNEIGTPIMWFGNAVNRSLMPQTHTLEVSSTPSPGHMIEVEPIDVNGQSSGLTNFVRTYPSGSLVTLTAQENPGMVFSGWSVNGTDVGNNPITVTMDKNNMVVANYKPIAPIRTFRDWYMGFDIWNHSGIIANDFHVALYGVYYQDLDLYYMGQYPNFCWYPIFGPYGNYLGLELCWYNANVMPNEWAHFGWRFKRWVPIWNIQWWWSWQHCTIYPQPWPRNILPVWDFNLATGVPISVISNPTPPWISPGPIQPPPAEPPTLVQRRYNISTTPIDGTMLMREGPGSNLWQTSFPIDPTPVVMPSGLSAPLNFDFAVAMPAPQVQGFAMMYDVRDETNQQVGWFASAVNVDPLAVITFPLTVDAMCCDGSPLPNVPISVVPPDINGLADGLTMFTRNYNAGTLVTLSAPPVHNGCNFNGWSIDGIVLGGNPINVTMDSFHHATAIYCCPPTLTGRFAHRDCSPFFEGRKFKFLILSSGEAGGGIVGPNGKFTFTTVTVGQSDICLKINGALSVKLEDVILSPGCEPLDLGQILVETPDVMNDDVWDDFDLNEVNGGFGNLVPPGSGADFNCDGIYDDFDLNQINGGFGTTGDCFGML